MLRTGIVAAIAVMIPDAAHATAAENSHAMAMESQANDADLIRSALSAAPPAVAREAAVVKMDATGGAIEVRKGSNGFTCMPDNPATPGPDPMCGDANALAWGQAWITHKEPPQGKVGFMYMLAGGTDASNTDPFAAAPASGNHWISTGPHVMVVGAMPMMQGYPESATPDTSKPYVMWAGTPYAHLMIPVR